MGLLKLTLEYEGTRYAGWQAQPHARTVQGELSKAAEQFLNERVEVGAAGETQRYFLPLSVLWGDDNLRFGAP